jgi:pantothenate kinase
MAGSALIARARDLGTRPGRTLLGITGAPGAGKSTLASALAAAVPGSVVVPMDGFHLTTAELAARDWVSERGTPRTFDADGFVALVRALRRGGRVLAPSFDRSREEPVPESIAVPSDTPLVVIEGNYLLVDSPPWSLLRDLLDEVWFVEAPEPVRLERLVARHVEFGRTPAEARRRATAGSDADNARLVAASRSRADLIVDAAELPA